MDISNANSITFFYQLLLVLFILTTFCNVLLMFKQAYGQTIFHYINKHKTRKALQKVVIHYEDINKLKTKKYIVDEFRKLQTCCNCKTSKSKLLEFHHLDPSQKDFAISQIIGRHTYRDIITELDKCVVLCRNCHIQVHNVIDATEVVRIMRKYQPIDTNFFNKFVEYD